MGVDIFFILAVFDAW